MRLISSLQQLDPHPHSEDLRSSRQRLEGDRLVLRVEQSVEFCPARLHLARQRCLGGVLLLHCLSELPGERLLGGLGGGLLENSLFV